MEKVAYTVGQHKLFRGILRSQDRPSLINGLGMMGMTIKDIAPKNIVNAVAKDPNALVEGFTRAKVRAGGGGRYTPLTGINISPNRKNPIYTFMHEFGHHLDMGGNPWWDWNKVNPGIIEYAEKAKKLADNPIIKDMNSQNGIHVLRELRANRMAARAMLRTGSPISEVKDYIRSMRKPISTYQSAAKSNVNTQNVIRKIYNKLFKRLPGAEIFKDSWKNYMGATMGKPSLLGTTARTGTDISFLPKNTMNLMKQYERATIDKLFGPKVIKA